MLSFVRFVIILFGGALLVLFAINNRGMVEISVWPLPYSVSAPLYLIILGAVAVGVFLGGTVGMLKRGRQGNHQLKAYRQKLEASEHALNALKRQQNQPTASRSAQLPETR